MANHAQHAAANTFSLEIGKLENQLQAWGTRIEALVSKQEAPGTPVKDDDARRLERVQSQHRSALARLRRARAEGQPHWTRHKAGLELAWRDLQLAMQRIG